MGEANGSAGIPAGSVTRRIPIDQARRMLAAGMLGAAFFLIQAGAAELMLRSDRLCREAQVSNWAFNPSGCQPEAVRFLLQGLSRGLLGAVRPDLPAVGVFSAAVLMGILAAFLGVLRWRDFALAYLVFDVLAGFVFGFLGFLLIYIG